MRFGASAVPSTIAVSGRVWAIIRRSPPVRLSCGRVGAPWQSSIPSEACVDSGEIGFANGVKKGGEQ